MPDYLDLYGLHLDGESQIKFPKPNLDTTRLVQQLTLAGEPLIREVNGKKVYNDGIFLSTAKTLQTIFETANYSLYCESLNQAYEVFLDSRLNDFTTKYNQEIAKKKGPFPFKLFNMPDKDYLLLLQQHLTDLERAKQGTGYHAITAEFKLLASYARYEDSYFKPYTPPATDPGTTNRTVAAPDQNLVMYVSGYMSDWQGAIREAYATAYKLGYNLPDIYVFTYKAGATKPLRLSDVYGPDAQIIGDARVLVESQNRVQSSNLSSAEKTELNQIIEGLLNKNDQ